MIRTMAVAAALLAGCSSDKVTQRGPATIPMPMGTAGTSAAPATIDIPNNACPPGNPFCAANTNTGMPVADAGPKNCGGASIDVAPAGVNIMIAVGGSPSMATHWSGIQTAIRSLYKHNPTAQFGVHVFWGEAAQDLGFSTQNMSNNVCGPVHNDVLEIGTHTEQELITALGDKPPGQWLIQDQIEISPVIEPLNYYLTHATKLADPTRTNYLVLLSNGNDNCFGSFFATPTDKQSAYQKIAVELYKQGIRVIPIGFDAPTTVGQMGDPILGVQGPDAVKANTDFTTLNTLLKYGGAVLDTVPAADNEAKLTAAVTQVGQRISNCRFALPSSLDPNSSVNPFALQFGINGQTVVRDRTEKNGWNFVSGGTSQVELFGDACVAIQSGQPIQVGKSCSSNVCGTASIKVETRPRAVLLLLDSSASRIECVDGSFDCLSDPNSTPNRPLTFWETVERAVNVTLTAPINDDIEFGMQFFPSKNAESLSCTVETQPEIPPTQGTEISIMRSMLEKLPFGFSPIVQIIENVAANPGRLADPDVLGAVVMLTDGGDNCSGADEPTIVSRMGAAAASLLKRGVKTYAIRYGSEAGRTPEGDEQLVALVMNGGTATPADPMNPSAKPYIDAKTAAEFEAALAQISDRLATCSFKLEGLPTMGAMKETANLYLNGEVIPFDAMGAKQDGWNWVDAERTTVELYGASCQAFKTNRRTSIVVEFGCPVVMVHVT